MPNQFSGNLDKYYNIPIERGLNSGSSQVPHEKENLQSRVSRLETQLSQLLNDNLALQGQCGALTARVKCLDSMANSAASSIPNMISATNKCKKRRLDALYKSQSVQRPTTSSPQEMNTICVGKTSSQSNETVPVILMQNSRTKLNLNYPRLDRIDICIMC